MNSEHTANKALADTARLRLKPDQQRELQLAELERAELLRRLGV